MALPSPEELRPLKESSRFGWLLYGNEDEMYEIHGGCGFSKKLLHSMSQVTYCAARLQQEPTSAIVPITARYLHDELANLRQWSSETVPWTEVQKNPQTIEWVKEKPAGYILSTHQEMSEVTAEAWRLAAIIYLQCRLLRYVALRRWRS